MAGAMGGSGGGTEVRRRAAGARALRLLAPWLAAWLAAGPAWAVGDGCGGGYRREGVISDFALGRAWTVYSSCGRPAGPRIAVPDGAGAPKAAPGVVPGSASGGGAFRAARPSPAAAQPLESALDPALDSASGSPLDPSLAPPPLPPLVRTGARVRLWLATPVARIELWGVALENGAAGAAVRVRTAPGGKVLDGTVRGADSVELSPEGFGGGGR